MRRRILLAMILFTFRGHIAFADDSAKPLKTQNGGPTIRTAQHMMAGSRNQDDPLPDPEIIPPLKQHFEYVLPTTCVVAVTAGPKFRCAGPDKEHLVCSGLQITVKGKVDDCLQINVVKDK